jgi:asparagine synthase (glutamine-hydrolysing)
MQGYMANTLLRDTDQMSMAFALETRLPFVDPEIVSFVSALPGSWKTNGGRPKPLLLDAVSDLVPEAVWRRPKMGFTLPFERWLRSVLDDELSRAFADTAGFARIGIPLTVQGVWNNFKSDGRRERWARPWALYTLKKWCELNAVQL